MRLRKHCEFFRNLTFLQNFRYTYLRTYPTPYSLVFIKNLKFFLFSSSLCSIWSITCARLYLYACYWKFLLLCSINLRRTLLCLMRMKLLNHGWPRKTWIQESSFLQWCDIQANLMLSNTHLCFWLYLSCFLSPCYNYVYSWSCYISLIACW